METRNGERRAGLIECDEPMAAQLKAEVEYDRNSRRVQSNNLPQVILKIRDSPQII